MHIHIYSLNQQGIFSTKVHKLNTYIFICIYKNLCAKEYALATFESREFANTEAKLSKQEVTTL